MATKTQPIGTTRRRSPEDRREQILDAALATFGERGLANARLDDIARRAGIAKGTIYLYYPSKEELFREVIRKTVVSRIEQAEHDAEPGPGPAKKQLERLLEAHWTFLRTDAFQAVFRLVLGELHQFPDLAEFYSKEVVARGALLMTRIIQRGIDRGEFRRVDPLVAARAGTSMFVIHAMWCANRDRFVGLIDKPDAEVFADLKDFFFHSLLAPDPSEWTVPDATGA